MLAHCSGKQLTMSIHTAAGEEKKQVNIWKKWSALFEYFSKLKFACNFWLGTFLNGPIFILDFSENVHIK
jgi:hypothetical protein